MVKVASECRGKGGVTGNECKIQSHEIERAKFKISTMTSVGDLEVSIFLHGLALV